MPAFIVQVSETQRLSKILRDWDEERSYSRCQQYGGNSQPDLIEAASEFSWRRELVSKQNGNDECGDG